MHVSGTMKELGMLEEDRSIINAAITGKSAWIDVVHTQNL